MKIKILITAIICLFTLSSCTKWFDVKPKKMVEQEDLFSSENGFKEALTGVYLLMGQTDLYGRVLTYGFMDVLGQYYSTGSGGYIQQQDRRYYQFPSSVTEEYTVPIWSKTYNIIANINNLLFFIERNRDLLQDGYYEIIKGEALGLRAFLHFDLLRMYGSIYKDNKSKESIAYRTELSTDGKILEPASKIIEYILSDLKAAEELLVNDPASFEFPTQSYEEDDMEGDPFLVYRHKRMNVYAVKALLARVNMYRGDEGKIEAAKYAQEIIDSPIFKLVSNNVDDRIFSKEIIFSIYLPGFHEYIAEDFGSAAHGFAINNKNFLNDIYSTSMDGTNDIRYKAYKSWGDGFLQKKYEQEKAWVSLESTIPLIRLSEMYYILAECSDDYTISSRHISTVREARGIDAISFSNEYDKLLNLEKEYRKEFSGEGQLFYFYKRNGYKTFLHSPLSEMTNDNYTFSIPDDEVLFGDTK